MLRRIGIALVVLGLLAAGVRMLVLKLASDATKIRWAIQDAAEGFSEARMDPVLAVLAREFRDETSGFGREDLRGALAGAFFGEKDPETKGFPYRCEIADEAIQIEVVKGEPDRATVSFPGKLVDARGGTRREAWSFQVEGRMEERPEGWCFMTTTHETLEGSFRLRAR
ncbi:MAG: hypothetical protein NTY35_01520 [Planctomycetota bacterium]|nr:hypothetical protein [Planctomycetota bacterium]